MPFFRTESVRRAEFQREAMPHLDAMYATALRLTRRPSDAEDLVQDSLLKAFRFYDRFEVGTNMKAWLLKIVTNQFINRYRRGVLEKGTLEGASAMPIGEGLMSREAMRGLLDPIDGAQRGLLAEEIQAALDELSEEHRLVVLLADIEELSYKEIAEIANVPIGTVMSRLHRARKSLQERLVHQAEALGIVREAPFVPTREATSTIDLDSYRRSKEARR